MTRTLTLPSSGDFFCAECEDSIDPGTLVAAEKLIWPGALPMYKLWCGMCRPIAPTGD